MPYGYKQSRISRTTYFPIGEHPVTGGPIFRPRPFSHPEKASTPQIPKLKYEALEISEVGGPFERKVLIHYSSFGPN